MESKQQQKEEDPLDVPSSTFDPSKSDCFMAGTFF
jgi:hypothetical protein